MIADDWREQQWPPTFDAAYLYSRLWVLEEMWEVVADLSLLHPFPFSPARQQAEMLMLLHDCYSAGGCLA